MESSKSFNSGRRPSRKGAGLEVGRDRQSLPQSRKRVKRYPNFSLFLPSDGTQRSPLTRDPEDATYKDTEQNEERHRPEWGVGMENNQHNLLNSISRNYIGICRKYIHTYVEEKMEPLKRVEEKN